MRATIKIWLDDAPEVEIRDGFAYVIDRSGEQVMERVMSITNLMLYVRRGERVLEAWRRSSGQGDGV
jgi:hypothetical protein